MCGGKPPPVQQRDLKAEEEAAARKATVKSNSEAAYRKSQTRKNSLIANYGGAGGVSAISQPIGKDRLG